MFPFVSIIIPIYNVKKYLQQCIDSILNWQFQDWEAILIDDGSTDGSSEICDYYLDIDPRFKVIHQQNSGVSIARNVGLNRAVGEWCWFVDADDIINPNTPVDFKLLKNKDIVIFNIATFFDGDPLPTVSDNFHVEESKDLNDFYKKHISWTHPTLWYHNKFWNKEGKYKIRFTNGIRVGEDGEFMRKCEFLSQNPLFISHVNYYYRLRKGSVTHKSDYYNICVEDTFIILNNMRRFLINNIKKPNEWQIYRIITIAKSIPSHAIKCDQWRKVQRLFKNIINDYKNIGWDLTIDNSIKIAYYLPYLYKFITKLYDLRKYFKWI